MKYKKESKRSPLDIYEYESKRIKEYSDKFYELVSKLDIDNSDKQELFKLFDCNGNARAIKSKAYQEMKVK